MHTHNTMKWRTRNHLCLARKSFHNLLPYQLENQCVVQPVDTINTWIHDKGSGRSPNMYYQDARISIVFTQWFNSLEFNTDHILLVWTDIMHMQAHPYHFLILNTLWLFFSALTVIPGPPLFSLTIQFRNPFPCPVTFVAGQRLLKQSFPDRLFLWHSRKTVG